ncbi:uncharacterized protein RCC_07379 [Ramularia collo-cygni]|uniref:Uncharacterized protein n=1 Tax=Ramularia collo-cygni TaxID=112498 RepID=A0A2D3VCP7_9PEZI|nr:uncharacterized protein RCC_07379 [Ramularia collo-cygni]CZT21516.1 uncharacterized protein RCC_07379 [Ramularia collo-cygni]
MATSPQQADLQQLLRHLDRQKEAYDEAIRRVQEHIALPPAFPVDPSIVPETSRHYSLDRTHASQSLSPPSLYSRADLQILTGLSTIESSSGSRLTGDESDDEADQSFCVREPLPQEIHGEDDFRQHLQTYPWDDDGKKVLQEFAGNKYRLQQDLILTKKGPLPDQSHHTHFQIFDIGDNGAPMLVEVKHEDVTNRPTALWQTIKTVNPDSRQRKAVGRVTIVREPAPVLFGALHYTMHKHFDVDELFRCLVGAQSTCCDLDRAFDSDPRRQSSFVFSFEYFTLIGEDCQPLAWQLADAPASRKPGHIAITRCSSIVALSLGGDAIKKIRNPDRRAGTTHGFVYDPWSPYHILNIQCFPDWESSLDVHSPTEHYVNGVEAFLVTVLGEYKDAEKRFEDIYKQISKLITPPLAFMFQSDLRDKLLFEDDKYTYSRRYFWAFQTLGIMIDSMAAMVDAYEDTFTDEVWDGRHRTLWPLLDPESTRNKYYKKKLSGVRQNFGYQVARIKKLIQSYETRRLEISRLRDQLFSGTSVMEARKSVQQAEITVQQGHNIKLLTLVNLFFLPLTFVTSVFGMEILPEHEPMWRFAAVTVAICLPCFILIGSLNSTAGLIWWQSRFSEIWNYLRKMWPCSTFASSEEPPLSRTPTLAVPTNANDYPLPSGMSTNAKMAKRLRRLSSHKHGDREKVPRMHELVHEDSIILPGTDLQWSESRQISRRMSERLETSPLGRARTPKEVA